jgi:NAD(P)-dependent dehydrogenase (short-subunit alcohol dehydrogenase family)
MPRIFITGSADGLGNLAARQLISQGHEVVLHARDEHRAQQALAHTPGARAVLTGELASLAETRMLAAKANELGIFDAVIHNAGIGYREPNRILTEDGIEQVFQINVLVPYVLTALITQPQRSIYLSSGLHRDGSPALDDLRWEHRPWSGYQAYSDSKLFDTMLAFAAPRHWPDMISTSVEPGWVPTKMGGAGAPDDLEQGYETQVWLANGRATPQEVNGRHLYHKAPAQTHPSATDTHAREALLTACEHATGTPWPRLEAVTPTLPVVVNPLVGGGAGDLKGIVLLAPREAS